MIKFIDDKIEYTENDIGKIQLKPNMYISYLGSRGALHLSKESINNAIDECINVNSTGNEINIYLDESENTLKVSDNGRGIPFDDMKLVCTTLQSGSKFTRKQSLPSAGENGVGLTAINSLSEFFELSSTRYGERCTIRFKEGILSENINKKYNKDKHGATVTFKPSSFYMGKECTIITNDLIEWVEKIIYLIPPDIKINLVVSPKGKESTINKKYRNKNGLYDYVKKITEGSLVDPIHLTGKMKFTELSKGVEYERFISIEIAFTFDQTYTHDEIFVDSFCNFINTVDNGVHVDAVKQGINQYLSREVKDSLNKKESKDIDIVYNDITRNMILTVYLSTDMQPEFSGQTKEKLTSNSFFKPLRNMTFKALEEYFKSHQKDLKKIVDFIKTIAKARTQANKIRNAVIKGDTNPFSDHLLKNFKPALNKGNLYREIFLIEGDSALGTARQARDTKSQALFSLYGVPPNTYDLRIDEIFATKNKEFQALVKILKCNIGEKFDISKLDYKKIIIMADSDVDGFRITSLICVFFLIHLPEIIKKGYLYKAISPLYRIQDKHKPFILDKREYIEVFERRIRNTVNIDNGTNILNNDEMKELLLKNRTYLDELYRISTHFNINPILMEFIVYHMNSEYFENELKLKFPEMSIDDGNTVSGIIEGKYQIVILDDLFLKRINSIKTFINIINGGKIYYKVTTTDNKRKQVMSLGEFFILCQKYRPKIETRFKGLGELNSKDLWETTMNPNKRILIQLTLEDVQKEVEVFRILHGEGPDAINERKKLMKNFKIDREELDN